MKIFYVVVVKSLVKTIGTCKSLHKRNLFPHSKVVDTFSPKS